MNQSTDPTPTIEPPNSDKGLHRHKKRRSSRKKENSFWQRYRLESGLLLTAIVSGVLLINPWRTFMPNISGHETTTNNVIYSLAFEGGSEILGGFCLFATVALGVVYIRKGVMLNPRFWRRAGCPRCGRDDLRRTSRLWHDRFLNRLGIPVRRYICADCHWQGARIDESHL